MSVITFTEHSDEVAEDFTLARGVGSVQPYTSMEPPNGVSMFLRARTCTRLAFGAALGLAAVPLVATPAIAADGDPKNVIVLISDGAGYNQFDIASLYEHGTSAH